MSPIQLSFAVRLAVACGLLLNVACSCPAQSQPEEAQAFQPPGVVAVPASHARPAITTAIQEEKLVPLTLGPALMAQAAAAKDLGRVAPEKRMDMQLRMKRSIAQERELAAFISATQNPADPLHGSVPGPEEFASRFGLAASDLEALEGWLLGKGFVLGNVDNGRMAIDFHGTAAQVEAAFHVALHLFLAADGATHYAAVDVPQVPKALFPVIGSLAGLEDFTVFRRAQFDGPVADFVNGRVDSLRLVNGNDTAVPVSVPAPVRAGEAVQHASFTALRYQMRRGQSTRLNVRVSAETNPVTGSIAIVDQHDKTVAFVDDITVCDGYGNTSSGDSLGRDCTVPYKATSAGTEHLTAIYSGDGHIRGAVLGSVDLATTGSAVTGTVLYPSPVGGIYNAPGGGAMIATVTWTATGNQPTGTVSIVSTFTGTFGTATMPAPGNYISNGTCVASIGTCVYTCVSGVADNIVTCTITDSDAFLITDRYPSIPYTATYNGDATYAPSSGSTLQGVWLDAPAYTMTVTPSITSLATVYGIVTPVTSSEQWTGDGTHPIFGPNPDYPNYLVTGTKQMGTMFGQQVTTATSNVTSADITGVNYSIPGNLSPGTYNVSYVYEGNSENASLFKSAVANVPLTVTQQTPVVTMLSPVSTAPTTQAPGRVLPFTISGSVAWVGPGVPPTATDLSIVSTAPFNFDSIYCVGTSSPSICSTTYTPTPSDPVGTYSINMTFSGDVNYTAAASAQVGNYVIAVPPPNLTFSSVSHDFGRVQVGTAAAAYGISVKNLSAAAYPFVLNFTPANGFTSANNCKTSLAAYSSCELVFYFTPVANAPVSALWSLAGESDFIYGPSDGGTLTGSGTGSGGVSLSTSTHNFGTVANGTTSPVYGVVLSNSTNAAVALTYGKLTSPFALSGSNCGASLAAGTSCNLQFTFAPASTGNVSQEYTVTAAGQTITSLGATVTGVTLLGK